MPGSTISHALHHLPQSFYIVSHTPHLSLWNTNSCWNLIETTVFFMILRSAHWFYKDTFFLYLVFFAYWFCFVFILLKFCVLPLSHILGFTQKLESLTSVLAYISEHCVWHILTFFINHYSRKRCPTLLQSVKYQQLMFVVPPILKWRLGNITEHNIYGIRHMAKNTVIFSGCLLICFSLRNFTYFSNLLSYTYKPIRLCCAGTFKTASL